MRKYSYFAVILCLCLAATCGCSKSKKRETPDVKDPKKQVEIGVIFDSFIIERWQRDRDAFVTMATDELGAKVNFQNANGDVKEQVRLINYFIDKKVDVLVIVPIDCGAITDAVKHAKEEGIKIIAYDRLIKNADVDLYITFDNHKVGSLMAQSINKNVPDGGKILMMCGPVVDNNVNMVGEGFKQELNESKITVAAMKHASNWLAESGFDFVSGYLSKHKSIDGIMCGNDGMAGQVIHALSERQLAGKVCVVGQDADLDACQRIVEGTQEMTVYKPVAKLAGLAAKDAVLLGTGGKLKVKKKIWDGSNHVPYIGLEPIAITKKNMNIVIEDGFHLKEDVYLNVK